MFKPEGAKGAFYHLNCFKELVRNAGKDPETFIKIIPSYPPSKN